MQSLIYTHQVHPSVTKEQPQSTLYMAWKPPIISCSIPGKITFKSTQRILQKKNLQGMRFHSAAAAGEPPFFLHGQATEVKD